MRTAGRAIVFVVLGCWVAPGAAALAAALHVEMHHHLDEREAAPAPALALQLAAAAEHGHSHEVTTPEHEHPATRAERLVAGPVSVAVPAADPADLDRRSAETFPSLPPPERRPPRSLFTLHCSLLR